MLQCHQPRHCVGISGNGVAQIVQMQAACLGGKIGPGAERLAEVGGVAAPGEDFEAEGGLLGEEAGAGGVEVDLSVIFPSLKMRFGKRPPQWR